MARRMSKRQIEANKRKANLIGEYGKERTRIMRAIGRLEKRGYILDENVLPKAPKNITKGSINKLKKITTKELYNKAEFLDVETGELISGYKGRIKELETRARKAQETKELKRKAEEMFWSGADTDLQSKTPTLQINLPNGGYIITDNILRDFVKRLSERTPTKTDFGSKRLVENYDASERERTTLLSLVLSVIERDGEEAVGWRLQEQGDLVWDLMQYTLYGSDSTRIASASRELADIINGGNLSMSDYADLAIEQEYNEDYELPT